MKGKRFDVKQFLGKNSVPVLFIIICAVLIPVSGLPVSYILNEAMTRLGRNAFLILSLLIPIMAGMGLNFAMTLGAMAGEIALILVADWQIWGIPGLVLAYPILTRKKVQIPQLRLIDNRHCSPAIL